MVLHWGRAMRGRERGRIWGARELSNVGDCNTTKTPQLEATKKTGPKVKVTCYFWNVVCICWLATFMATYRVRLLLLLLLWGTYYGNLCCMRPLCSWNASTSLQIATLLCVEECSQSRTTNTNIVESITFCRLILTFTICWNSVHCKRWIQHQRSLQLYTQN